VLKIFHSWNNLEYYSKLIFRCKRGGWNILFQIPTGNARTRAYFSAFRSLSAGSVLRTSDCVTQPRLACATPNVRNA
jgi:hypothetical protein